LRAQIASDFRVGSRSCLLSFIRKAGVIFPRVMNWREYDAALRNRGSLTIWFTPDAIAGWKAQPRTTPGGQRHYSDLAIETALTLRAVFRLALRQSEGLIASIMGLLEIDLPIPDHTTLSRRACGLPICKSARIGTGELHLIVAQHWTEIARRGRMVVRKTWNHEATLLAQIAHWHRRRQRRDRRL
jgi:hypothetical protein